MLIWYLDVLRPDSVTISPVLKKGQDTKCQRRQVQREPLIGVERVFYPETAMTCEIRPHGVADADDTIRIQRRHIAAISSHAH